MIKDNGTFADVCVGVVRRMKEIDDEVRKLRDERNSCEQFLQACNKLWHYYESRSTAIPACRVCNTSAYETELDEYRVCIDCLADWQRYKPIGIMRKNLKVFEDCDSNA